ncbi:unnamed protein product [[Candida] boidinii]|uniref:Unnamed protein product n=1 Tax=Candida boidinii TaxID=5477 RepID=A0ACB5U4F9_CANBO|nr:unnamed protein product [[Candida] boidinii]
MDTVPNNNLNKASEISLIDASIQTITECFEGEGTDERIELQVIRVLTAAILNEHLPVHGKVLLQAVRQIYNIFLLSLSASNQGIAQATLTQIVNVVFEKVKDIKNRFSKGQSSISILNNNNHDTRSIDSTPTAPATPVKMSLKTMQNMSTDDDINYMEYPQGDDDETNIRDAFLIFRSMKMNLKEKYPYS